MKESLKFYNHFDEKLIKDYAYGNKRIISAIQSLAEYVPCGEKIDVLDFGCGLGWSIYELPRFFKNATFEGLDLSPVLIDETKN